MKETSFREQTWDLFNILPTKLNKHLSPLLELLQATQKKIRKLSVQLGLRGSNDLRVVQKMTTFQFFFPSREQVLVRRGQIQRIGWVIKKMEAQVGQFLPGCECPVTCGIVVHKQDPLVIFPRRFSFKMSFNCTSRDG